MQQRNIIPKNIKAILAGLMGITAVIVFFGIVMLSSTTLKTTLNQTANSNQILAGGQTANQGYGRFLGNLTTLPVLISIILLIIVIGFLFLALNYINKNPKARGGGEYVSEEGV